MSLLDKVADVRTLRAAWHRVRKRAPLPGTDGVTVEEFEARAGELLQELAREIAARGYRPMPLQRFLIPKSGGEERPVRSFQRLPAAGAIFPATGPGSPGHANLKDAILISLHRGQ